MKKLTLLPAVLLTLGLASQSIAQENISTESSPVTYSPSKLGISVGVEYINVSDYKVTTKETDNYGSVTRDESSGMHLGMIGLGAAYNKLDPQQLGAIVKLRILKSFNKSEVGAAGEVTMIIPEVNLAYSFNSAFSIYGGGNISIWRGNEYINKYQPGLGIQAGLLFKAGDFSMNAGSTLMSQSYKGRDEYRSGGYSYARDYEVNYLVSGFSTGVSYNF